MVNTKVLAIVISSILALGITSGIVFQIVINSEVQKTVDATTVDVLSIKVLNATENSLFMQLNISINNPKDAEATLEPFVLELSYNTTVIGHIEIPSLDVAPKSGTITVDAVLKPVDQTTFNQFVNAFISQKALSLKVYGEAKLKAKAFLLSVSSSAVINKTITITGLNNFKDLRVEEIQLLNNTEESIFTKIKVNAFNPSPLSITLKDVLFALSYKGSSLGNVNFSNLELLQGENEFENVFELKPGNLTVIQELVTNFLSDKNSTIDVAGTFIIKPVGLLEEALSQVHFTTVLVGQGNISLKLNEFKLYSITTSTIEGQMNVTLYNPTNVEGNISNILLDLIYESNKLGTLLIPSINLSKGSNVLVSNFTLSPETAEILTDFASSYLNGTEMTLVIQGSKSGNTLSSLLSGWQQTIVITNNASFNVTITEIGILNSTATSIFLRTGFMFYNPTDVNIELLNATFEVIWNDKNASLGILRIPHTELSIGFNKIKEDVELIPDNSSLVVELINAYLSGEEINLTLIGQSSQNDILSSLLKGYSLDFTLPAISPLDIMVVSLDFYNISSNSVDFNVTIQVTNPSASAVTVNNLTFEVDYNAEQLGNITIDTMTADPGTETYNIIITFTASNDTLLTELLTDYINGEQITLKLKCVAVQADIIGNIIQKYVSDIQLPVLNLGIEVKDITLVNSTADTVSIDLEVNVNNPVSFKLTLDNMTFDLFYNGIRIGNATIAEVTLEPGLNVITLHGMLSAETNRTNLEEFLSQYVNGHDVTVTVNGNFTSSFSGLIPDVTIPIATQVTLKGLQRLVENVVVDEININLSYDPYQGASVTYDVKLNVSVINPMSFDIDLIAWGGDIYFNDTDESSYYIISYTAKYNIYLTTINETNLTEVLHSKELHVLQYLYSDNNIEKGIRLNDELNKGKLYIALENGWITTKIGDFEITLNFEMYDIHVTQN